MKREKAHKIKKQIVPILRKNGVLKAAIFGSVVRGEEKRGSDIDILIQPKKGTSLFDIVGLRHDLEKVLKRKVDLVTYNSLHRLLRDQILEEQYILYEKKSGNLPSSY